MVNTIQQKGFSSDLTMFMCAYRRENVIQQIEVELEQEKRMADNLVADMVCLLNKERFTILDISIYC